MTTITLTPDIEDALLRQARAQGTTPERLVLDTLREKLALPTLPPPRDDWERLLRSLTVDAGVSLTNEQASSETYYD